MTAVATASGRASSAEAWAVVEAHSKFLKNSADLKQFGDLIRADQFAALNSSGATEDVYIIRLERNVPQRIRMFIWLEGQDADCVNEVNTAGFVLSLELAGSSDETQ